MKWDRTYYLAVGEAHNTGQIPYQIYAHRARPLIISPQLSAILYSNTRLVHVSKQAVEIFSRYNHTLYIAPS